jgi:stage II sporulation protein P
MIKFNQVGGPRNILVVCDFPKKAKELFDRWCEAMYKHGVRFRTRSDILTIDVVDGNSFKFIHDTYAEEKIRDVLEEYPSIEVIIDLHRDGVDENTRLVTSVNGKDTAQIMLLNGLCRTTTNGPISYLQNNYLTENLAFSFQVQAKGAQYYPSLMRKIYLRSYQYNLHILPRCLLVECGAQTNTVTEAQNAMPLLADLLYLVLSGN